MKPSTKSPRKLRLPGFRFLDHTADVIIEAWGPTVEKAFEQAGYGFYTVLLNPKKITPTGNYEVELEGHSLETLLYRWIEEFIFLLDAEGLVCTDLEISSINHQTSPVVLKGRCGTESFDSIKHEARAEVKAMTFAELKITQTQDETLLRFTLDL
ncbi:MAG: archease [Candidatus Ranarchaeia archaeon]|jgi:SHS2 domain-containing protein